MIPIQVVKRTITAFIALIILQFSREPVTAQQPSTAQLPHIYNTRISVGYDGSQANGSSFDPTISDNGRYVVFFSNATNLVPNDTNGKTDVFVFDLETEEIELVSVSSSGEQANDNPRSEPLADISDDGRYVVFASHATNLAEININNSCRTLRGDPINCPNVFIRDRQTSVTRLISVSSDGVQGDDESMLPSISADGRYVTFTSNATNLVPNDTNNRGDIFLHDLQTHQTQRVSVSSSGAQADKGAFQSSISSDGRYVSFIQFDRVDDVYDKGDVFVRDIQRGETTLISGNLDNPNIHYAALAFISGNGRYVAFAMTFCSHDGTCSGVEMYRYDRQNDETVLVSTAYDGSAGDGRSMVGNASNAGEVFFLSEAANLTEMNAPPCEYCANMFLRNAENTQTTLVSKSIHGGYENGSAWLGFIAAVDGNRAVFCSTADDLVVGDSNGYSDVFVYGWKTTLLHAAYLPLVFKHEERLQTYDD